MKHSVLLLAATFGVAACTANHVSIGAQAYSQLYYPQLVSGVTAGGHLATVIRGNPFGAGPVDAEAIAAALPAPGIAPAFRYEVTTPEAARKHARLVLIFGPNTAGPGESEDCNDAQAAAIHPGGGPITVKAVFCVGPNWTSTLFASGRAAKDASDPEFQSLMGQVIAGLMPADQPLSDHGSAGASRP